jgi:hypothetical protein
MVLTPEQDRRFRDLSAEARAVDPATAGPEEVYRLQAILDEMCEILPLPRRSPYHGEGRAVDFPIPLPRLLEPWFARERNVRPNP